jgi:subtilisin-like proprotein convertase family protein
MLAAALLAGCGDDDDDGGGSGGSGSGGGLPNQSGCFYTYTLTQLPPLTGTDPLFAKQWHLQNTGQSGGTAGEDIRAVAAWAITKGLGARIAVIDDALETLHEDLSPNVLANASFSYRPATRGSVYPLPCSINDDHGTSVGGVAAARDDNGVGVVGVAPRAGLVGYSALQTSSDADITDALNRGLADNGVYNNSWGSPDDGLLNPAGSSFLAAIGNGIDAGRGGRGAVYVFPGGNGGCYALDNFGRCVSETTGLDGYLNHRGVIAVCAVDHRGRHPSYAEPGANLLVCAPGSDTAVASSITTTKVLNAYRDDFSGTSASVPMVSGVVALMLSANPNLSWRDVRLILAQTARRNDAADAGWAVAADGRAYHPKYGFGVVDAQAAVTAARTWTSVGGSGTLRSCGPYARFPNQVLPDAAGSLLAPREDTAIVDAECNITRIEYVEVSFTATHSYSGDLRVRLISPRGYVSELAAGRICDGVGDACGRYDGWTFGSVRHLGEPAAGGWRLEVADTQADDIGTWNAWSIRFWGR